jgi:hypothetical protein
LRLRRLDARAALSRVKSAGEGGRTGGI